MTAVTGIDALSHALESYVTTRRNPLSQMFAREAWRLLERNLETVLRQPDRPGSPRRHADGRLPAPAPPSKTRCSAPAMPAPIR